MVYREKEVQQNTPKMMHSRVWFVDAYFLLHNLYSTNVRSQPSVWVYAEGVRTASMEVLICRSASTFPKSTAMSSLASTFCSLIGFKNTLIESRFE